MRLPPIWLAVTSWAVLFGEVGESLQHALETAGKDLTQAIARIEAHFAEAPADTGSVDTGEAPIHETGILPDPPAEEPVDSGDSGGPWAGDDADSADTAPSPPPPVPDTGHSDSALPDPPDTAQEAPDTAPPDDLDTAPVDGPDTAVPAEAPPPRDTADSSDSVPPTPAPVPDTAHSDSASPPDTALPAPADSEAPVVRDTAPDSAAPTDTASPDDSAPPPVPDTGQSDSEPPADTAVVEPELACYEIIPDLDRGVAAEDAPNLLVVVMDDVGVEMLGAYDAVDPVPTPTLDALADAGIVFDRGYASPTCSPTRAELMTGRHPPHNTIGQAMSPDDPSLPCNEYTAATVLRTRAGYRTAMVGKWHLDALDEAGAIGPLVHGFDHWKGTLGNLSAGWATDGLGQNYFDWERIDQGVPGRDPQFATTTNVDDAIAILSDLREPWVLVLAFNAAHAPYQRPPEHLLSGGPLPEDSDDVTNYRAAIEAADTELGRLLASFGPGKALRTQTWWLGDNGTPESIVPPPAKGSPYEAGVHVPFVVSGAGIVEPGRRSSHLIQPADFLPTAMTQVDANASAAWWASLDGVSQHAVFASPDALPARATAFGGTHTIKGGVLAKDSSYVHGERFKLVRRFAVEFEDDSWELYDMLGAGEAEDLLLAELSPEAAVAYDTLVAAHATVWEARPPAPPW